MLNENEFAQLTQRYPSLKGCNAKLLETLRDQLKPSEVVTFAGPIVVSAGPGLICLTETDVYLLWNQKLFYFFKFPAIQTLHRAHLKLEQNASRLHLVAGEEENSLHFASLDQAEQFLQALNPPAP